MPRSHEALQGRTPEKAETALLLVDLINDLEFEEGGELLTAALPVGRAVAELKRQARGAGVPAIYVNDNFGKWRSDFSRLVRHGLEGGVRGRPLAELLLPEEDDYFVLKPGLSGFYSTTLAWPSGRDIRSPARDSVFSSPARAPSRSGSDRGP
jgi:nicotinamidase-related amidase